MDIGKVAVAILEDKVKAVIGEEAIKELKKPVIEGELERSIAEAAKYAEERWKSEYDDRDAVSAVSQLPLHDLPGVRAALRTLFDHPADPILAQTLRGQLGSDLPKDFDADRVEAAVAAYVEILRTELVNVQGLREKLNALANSRTALNTAQTVDELQEMKELLARLLSKDLEIDTLYDKVPQGPEGAREFACIVDLLMFHEARRVGRQVDFPLATGGYHGLGSFDASALRMSGATVYQYVFCSSPFSDEHRQRIVRMLERIVASEKDFKPTKWVLVTPQDLTVSDGKDRGDVAWFEGLKGELGLELEHWGHTKLLSLFTQTPALCLYYYPQLVDGGAARKKTIQDTTRRYFDNLGMLYRNIEFVGMSVYKPEATKGVPMEHIYIPLSVVPSASDERDPNVQRTDPVEFLAPGARHVILGDPGSGKSTLLRFLSLAGSSQALQKRYHAKPDKRLPVLVILRRYADELKSRKNLSLIDYILENIQADFSLESADLDFFEYYLETGQAILFFDGLDELPSSYFKEIVRNRIRSLITTYPGNTAIVTSRIVGYDDPFRFDEEVFGHYRVAKLQLPEMEQFARDWYIVRIKNRREREANVQDLVRILRSEDHAAIRELAENPLLLTIIALVHRIDAVLPDERVILYQKCTETLLNTWHTWKFRETGVQKRGRVERRNRRRMEVIANWMHRSGETGAAERAVVPYADLKEYLTAHIAEVEKSRDPESEPQDLADGFLEFVKKRAGLLIEVGDRQYSFVHRTFQEYLTSSHIITSGEKGGAQSIWDTIGGRCGDDRWHEVIRLLVAGLRSTETQEWLIDKILAEKTTGPDVNRSLLLGGLLLDSVESAELRQGEILTDLLRSGSLVEDVEQLRRASSMLRAWLAKGDESADVVKRAFQSLWQAAGDDGQRTALALMAYTLGWSEAETAEIAGRSVVGKGRDAACFRLFFGEVSDLQDIDSLMPNIERLWRAQDVLSLQSLGGNVVAAATQAVTATLPRIFARRAFEKHLVVLSAGANFGPYRDFLVASLIIVFDDQAAAHEWKNVLDWALALDRALDRARDRALDRALDLDLAQGIRGGGWRTILAAPEAVSTILDLLRDLFELEPRAQWWEALRVVFLPQVPERLTLFDQAEWRRVERAFAENKAGDTEVYSAAWQLLFDAWLYIFKCYERPEESLFAGLAQLTSDVDAPPLCIAHCIRDLAYGDESRADDLAAMVQSDDPAYRSIFETCLWLPTPEEEAREAKEALG